MALNTVSSDRLSTNVKNTNFTAAEKQDLTDDIKPLLGSSGGGNKNLIINGAMLVAQRGTSSTTNGYGSVDRFKTVYVGTDEAPTQEQVDVASGTTPYNAGFRKAFRLTNGNQTGGAGSNDLISIDNFIEAQNLASSGWNYTSASSSITLTYYVKSSVAQNFFVRVLTKDGTSRRLAFQTGSLTADTWTKITKTFPGDSGITINNDNGTGLEFRFYAFAGTDRTDNGVTLDAWATHSSGSSTPDQTSTWYTTNNATLEITGVQLEVGNVATEFDHRSFAQELILCQRYFNKKNPGYGRVSQMPDTTICTFTMDLPCEMRASPTITNSGGLYMARQNGNALTLTGINHGSADTTTARITLGVSSSATAGESAFIWSGATYYLLDAEL